ncbi:MAG TPA: LuxR C-terminal-related transcriptional regulator [Gaiellaceae bacterium]|nr:LuxR C-terminal-related transcriptional regulator [Gaiellaceae bacterium]
MARTSEQQRAAERVDAGWAELARGGWTEARLHFRKALSADESPKALEGLSWAAWWLDDADTVFDCRERAYRLYRQQGNAAAAARMATWLASDQLDFHGAAVVASGWLRRARRLLEPLEKGPDHGWLAFHEGYLALAAGDSRSASEQATATAHLGREFGIVDLEMLGLALEGAALVASTRIDEGMACLDEATTMALEGEAAIPISSAWTCCFLVSACMKVLDLERAAEWCDRIERFAEQFGSRYMLAFCRAEYGSVYLARGRWSDAEAMLEASIEDFSRSRPAWVGGPLSELAELRRRQGRSEQAHELLDRAGSSRAAELCRARMTLDRNETLEAAELLERLLRRLPEANDLDRAPVLELLVRARAMRGELDEAAAAFHALRAIELQVGTPLVRAVRDLAEGRLAAAHGNHDRARVLLEDAADRFDSCGTPFEAAQARIELAASLVELGRADAAEREAAAALHSFVVLGADGEAQRARLRIAAPTPAVPLPQLTRREREVVCLLAEGLTDRQIAARLVVSKHTVHRHVTNILRKLDAPSRSAAAAQAVREGLLDVPPA